MKLISLPFLCTSSCQPGIQLFLLCTAVKTNKQLLICKMRLNCVRCTTFTRSEGYNIQTTKMTLHFFSYYKNRNGKEVKLWPKGIQFHPFESYLILKWMVLHVFINQAIQSEKEMESFHVARNTLLDTHINIPDGSTAQFLPSTCVCRFHFIQQIS